jgi:hypothetical protein
MIDSLFYFFEHCKNLVDIPVLSLLDHPEVVNAFCDLPAVSLLYCQRLQLVLKVRYLHLFLHELLFLRYNLEKLSL